MTCSHQMPEVTITTPASFYVYASVEHLVLIPWYMYPHLDTCTNARLSFISLLGPGEAHEMDASLIARI